MVGRDRFIYDEVPAVVGEHEILGLHVVLQGSPEEGYVLDLMPTRFPAGSVEEDALDIGPFVVILLSDLDGVKVSAFAGKPLGDDRRNR